jgi:hypothetical protein
VETDAEKADEPEFVVREKAVEDDDETECYESGSSRLRPSEIQWQGRDDDTHHVVSDPVSEGGDETHEMKS